VPTYEYRCKACGNELEAVQSFTDDALTTCPACGAEELRKVFGAVGISFKGSGFYKTDSRGKSSSSASSSSSGNGASTPSSSESSSSESSSSSSSDTGSTKSDASGSSSGAKTA
jgi:putative FmdB family regulatory protein